MSKQRQQNKESKPKKLQTNQQIFFFKNKERWNSLVGFYFYVMLPCKHCHVYCMVNCVITFCHWYKYTTRLGVSGSLLQWPTHEYQKKFQLLTTLLLLFLAQSLSQYASYFSNETNQKSFFNVHCDCRFFIAFLQYLVLVLTQPPQKLYPEHCVFYFIILILPVYYFTKKFTCFYSTLTFKKPSLISLTHTPLCADHINYLNLCKDMEESLIF